MRLPEELGCFHSDLGSPVKTRSSPVHGPQGALRQVCAHAFPLPGSTFPLLVTLQTDVPFVWISSTLYFFLSGDMYFCRHYLTILEKRGDL